MGEGVARFSVEDWTRFLSGWGGEALALQREIAADGSSDLSELAADAIDRGLCMFPAASEAEISTAEKRLETELPLSYRTFLQASNGFVILGLDVEDALMRPAQSISWLRDGEPGLVAAWARHPSRGISDDIYFTYGDSQDCVHIRTEYFPSLLQLSDFVESAAVLLNPMVKTAQGEWEGWDFGTAYPGAFRFRSFEDMMLALRKRTLQNLRSTVNFTEMTKHRLPQPRRN